MIGDGVGADLRERARAAGFDLRQAWIGEVGGVLQADPPALARTLGLPALDPAGPARLKTLLEPLRASPAHRAEMISELRSGESLSLLFAAGDWWLVRGEDGYVGWVHAWVLEQVADDGPGAAVGRFALPLGTLWHSDHWAASPLLMGMPLLEPDAPRVERGGHRLVRLATGMEGWLPVEQIAAFAAWSRPEDLLDGARALLGTPYRWGGRSPLGFDCSGFVQYLAGLAGARLPRDASQQLEVGEAVGGEPDAFEAADLLFFGDPPDHVALADGRGGIFHCQGRVRRDALGEVPQLMARLHAVRRWWGQRGRSGSSLWVAPVGDQNGA